MSAAERCFMETMIAEKPPIALTNLPGDDVRQRMWRFAGRCELHMLVQSVRGVACEGFKHLLSRRVAAHGWPAVHRRAPRRNLDPNCGWARGKAGVLYVADAFKVMAKVNELLAGGKT